MDGCRRRTSIVRICLWFESSDKKAQPLLYRGTLAAKLTLFNLA